MGTWGRYEGENMASLSSFLPAPSQLTWDRDLEEQKQRASQSTALVAATKAIPPYGNRSAWIPRNVTDFGDGGAFPEIQMAQYPLDMGRKDEAGGKSNALAIQLDAEGKIKYDAIARQGHDKDKFIYSKFTDLLPAEITNEDDPSLHRPSQEEIEETTEKTRLALEKITNAKVEAALPVRAAEKLGPTQYIRYTPAQQGEGFNSGAKQRIIRMVEVQKDPMEPARFKINQKLPRGPPSPPPPVMHSPTRKVTVNEQQEWKIPPCISNWKNAKGHTIPLDKRLAADGRGLQSVHINENFAKLAEAARNKRAGISRKDDHEDEVTEREGIRHERHRERARQRNIDRAAPDKRRQLKGDGERDISEQIALGLPNTRGRGNNEETQFDQRLFNRSKGMNSGFGGGEDESYNVYDQPWRKETQVGNSIYRPTKDKDSDMYGDGDIDKIISSNRFVADKGFKGADSSRGQRDGPVQFEKNRFEDVFGIDRFMEQAKQASKRPNESSRGGGDRNQGKRSRKQQVTLCYSTTAIIIYILTCLFLKVLSPSG